MTTSLCSVSMPTSSMTFPSPQGMEKVRGSFRLANARNPADHRSFREDIAEGNGDDWHRCSHGALEIPLNGCSPAPYAERMPVTAIFPKSRDRERVATFLWVDGTAATTPIWGRPERLPHDLDHYIVEAAFLPPYGFWSLVEQQSPFPSLTLVKGRWPKDKAAWFERVVRKHGTEMLKAEATGLEVLFEAGEDEVDRLIPELRRRLRTSYALSPANAFADAARERFLDARNLHRKVHRAWQGVPFRGALAVNFPPAANPKIYERFDPEEVVAGNRQR